MPQGAARNFFLNVNLNFPECGLVNWDHAGECPILRKCMLKYSGLKHKHGDWAIVISYPGSHPPKDTYLAEKQDGIDGKRFIGNKKEKSRGSDRRTG